jgi:CBS domain-containing protein
VFQDEGMPTAFDFSIPPFDRLTNAELERFEASLDVAFFRQGEVIIDAGQVPESFFIVIKGQVHELDGEAVVAVHRTNDCFDTALLMERVSTHRFVVYEEAICYLLPLDELLDLTANNKAFAEFFFRDISLKLDALRARQEIRELAPVTMARVRDAYIHPPLFVDPATSVFDAASLMKAQKATSLLVREDQRVGIVTGYDLRESAILRREPLDTPIGRATSWNVVAIDADAFLIEGLLQMTRHGVRRLVVRDRDTILGVLEQVDLLSFLSGQSHIVALRIDRASNIEDLKRASEQLPVLVQVMHGQGTKIRYVTQIVAELSRRIQARLFEMTAPPEMVENACLIVMGSEGRGDQILKTDQDNGLILKDGFEHPALAETCRRFTDGMLEFGYPPCDGGVMVSNLAWSKSLAAYRRDLRNWVVTPDDRAVMNIAIFFDATAVAGDPGLLSEAKSYLFDLTRSESAFYLSFARRIDSIRTPLGIYSDSLVEKLRPVDEIDIKKGAIFPLVHGIRALALERQVVETNTTERIHRLTDLYVLDKPFARDLIEAFEFFLGLRLKARLEKMQMEQELNNLVRPHDLDNFERDLLKDAFGVVNRFKEVIRYHFHLQRF